MKTIKEVSKTLGVSKTTIYKKLDELGITGHLINGVKHLSDDDIKAIKDSLNFKPEVETVENNKGVKDSKDIEISALKEQLNILNLQLKELKQDKEQLNALILSLNNKIDTLLRVNEINARTLNIDTNNRMLESITQDDKKKGFFDRLKDMLFTKND